MWSVRAEFRLGAGDVPGALAYLDQANQDDMSDFWAEGLELERLTAQLMGGGMDDTTFRALEELTDKHLTTADPQFLVNMVSNKLRYLLPAERYEEALALAQRYIDIDIAYPSTLEGGILAAAMCGDAGALRELRERLVAEFPRGRACVGLAALSSALIAALDGDTDTATVEFRRADDIWVHVIPPVVVNLARGIFATTLGFDHPEAVAIAGQAREFFEERDLRLFLDGIVTRFPAELTADDVAV